MSPPAPQSLEALARRYRVPLCDWCGERAMSTRDGVNLCDEHRRYVDAAAGFGVVAFAATSGLGLIATALALLAGAAGPALAGAFITGGSALMVGRFLALCWRRSEGDD